MRLIDADAIKLEKGFFENINNVPKFFEWLGKQPTIDPVKTAYIKDPMPWGYCSNCGELLDPRDKFNFCPNCGAKMNGELSPFPVEVKIFYV